MKKSAIIILILLFVATNNFAQTIFYVDIDRPNNDGDGLTWVTAKKGVQAAIDAAEADDEVWVKAGTYKPTEYQYNGPITSPTAYTSPQSRTFHLKNKVKVYGGFLGTEMQRSQRNYNSNVTILSGDFNNDSTLNRADDAMHVVVSVEDDSTTILDGFTIQYGHAAGGSIGAGFNYNLEEKTVFADKGGGIYSTGGGPTIQNCILQNNHALNSGGAMSYFAYATINNTIFKKNSSDFGGAIEGKGLGLLIDGCTFIDNTANLGGAIRLDNGGNVQITNSVFERNNNNAILIKRTQLTITNSIFLENFSNAYGGVINAANSGLDILNSTFKSNYAAFGGGVIYHINNTMVDPLEYILNTLYLKTTNCTFVGNKTTGGAALGGVFLLNKVKNTHINSFFISNSSNYSGGVLSSTANSSDFSSDFTNCVFNRNKAENKGAILHVERDANIVNSTLIDNNSNSSNGLVSAIASGGAYIVKVKNSIVSNGLQVAVGEPAIRTNYCLFTDDAPAGTGNFVGNPLFVNTADYDGTDNIDGTNDDGFNIQAASAAINASDAATTTPNIDIKNYTRGGRFDVGAYEYCIAGGAGITIVNQPSNATAVTNSSVSFSVAAIGSSLHYQWKKGTTNVGTNSNTFTLNNVTAANAGTYSCVISNPCNGLTSVSVTLTVTASQNIFYVRSDAGSNSSNGSTWALAKRDIQEAIDLAQAGDMIWVKAGTYKPTKDPFGNLMPTNTRNKTFYLKNGVKIYGGFAGTETTLQQRNATTNVTILTGDIDNNSPTTNTDDVYHVVLSVKDNINTVLDGFNIRYGNATGGDNVSIEASSVPQGFGGGMCNFASWPIINNCIFANCIAQNGGAIENTDNTFATITNCKFLNNAAKSAGGGAIANEINSDPKIENCIFSGNLANGSVVSAGGAIYVSNGGNCTATNCVFSSNSANFDGGAIKVDFNSTTDITNCTFYNNTATGATAKGGGVYYDASSSGKVANSILANNTTPNNNTDAGSEQLRSDYVGGSSNSLVAASNCIIKETSGVLNIANVTITDCSTEDPLFVDAANADGVDNIWATADDGLGLATCSPAINSSNTATFNPTKDITGFARIGVFDIGAYEKQGATGLISCYKDLDADGYGNTLDSVIVCTTCPVGYVNNSKDCDDEVAYVKGTIIYVNANIAQAGTGTSWSCALKSLQDAVDVSVSGDTILVAKGTYYPSYVDPLVPSNSQSFFRHFYLKNGVAIYGGFVGYETDIKERNAALNTTILSGDFNNNDAETGTNLTYSIINTSENALQVVKNINVDSTAILDGFTIKGGNADGNSFGINNGMGGGMLNKNASPTISNCVFINNTASYGGAVTNRDGGKPSFINCVFTKNKATNEYGGGIFNFNGTEAKFTNCVIYKNILVTGYGSAMVNYLNANTNITNCTIIDNYLPSSNTAIYGIGSSTVINNSIIHYNYTNTSTSLTRVVAGDTNFVTNSIIQHYYTGIGNILYNGPNFVNFFDADGPDNKWGTADDGLRVSDMSQVINKSDINTISPISDITGFTRFGIFDMGAYENRCVPVVNTAVINTTGLSSYAQYITGNTYLGGCNNIIGRIEPGVANTAINGPTTIKMWNDATQHPNYLRRHYEITPVNNATTATGRITLFFSTQDVALFNMQTPPPSALLPNYLSTGTELSNAIANLLIEKRNGTSNDGSGTPSSYTNGYTTIDPADVDIIWNSQFGRWQVSFDVTGFSGFFIKTTSGTLPIKWLAVKGNLNTLKQPVINWKVQEDDVLKYEVEKSEDGQRFVTIAIVNSAGNGTNTYTSTDAETLQKKSFFKIKQISRNGNTSYSEIVVLNAKQTQPTIYPNPAYNNVTITVPINHINKSINLISTEGKVIKTILPNHQSETIDISNLQNGLYLLQFSNGTVQKFVKH